MVKMKIGTLFLQLVSVFLLTLNSVYSDTPPLIDENAIGIPAAFGDFDSDKLTDVFVIDNDCKSFSMLRGYPHEPLLRPEKKWHCDLKKTKDSETIISLMPADFHGQAMMDVLVVTKTSVSNQFNLYLVRGDKSNLNCSALEEGVRLAQVKSEPLLMDYNHDMITDIFAQNYNDSKRYVWIAQRNSTFLIQQAFSEDSNDITNPNSNAFVDINHDDLPDVFINGVNHIEFWYMSNTTYLNTSVKGIHPKDAKVIGQSTFADLNADGNIEHIKPICKDKDCKHSAIVAFIEGHKWVEIASNFTDPDSPSNQLSFVNEATVKGMTYPLTLRQADVDGDSYTDLIALMRSNGQDKVIILKNTATSDNALNRTFVASWNIKVPDGRRPVLAAFYDLHEDGRPDILIATVDKSKARDQATDYKIHGTENSQMVDACFLKVMVASGLCFDDCSQVTKNSQPLETNANSPVAYGTNQPGPNVCYELIDTEGFQKRGCAGQLTQSASLALQMPYTIFGLGSTPNFIDRLQATIPSNGTHNIRMNTWTQIVPDAQVVLIPYPPEKPRQWRSKLFITPSDIVLSTLITLACICCLLILIIAVLHRKEILEDLAEHEEYKRHWPDSR